MNPFLLVSTIILWAVVLFLAFLLLGTLRTLGLLSWRLDQLQAVTPSRLGRDGLKLRKKAPDFALPAVAGGEMALHDFAGRKVLLVFVQGGCSPCHQVVPDLNKRQRKGEVEVLAIFNGPAEASRKWLADVKAEFPVLSQQQFAVSKTYQVFATPFAFLIDERASSVPKVSSTTLSTSATSWLAAVPMQRMKSQSRKPMEKKRRWRANQVVQIRRRW
jgi:peroxiredoxin